MVVTDNLDKGNYTGVLIKKNPLDENRFKKKWKQKHIEQT
jgi:hypothetical protein